MADGARLVTVAPGVHAWIGAGGDSNAGAIETPDGVLVIDARAMAQSDQVRQFGASLANETGRALAYRLRGEFIDAMDSANAGHFQIGRTYAAHPGVPKEAQTAWPALKQKYDPDRIMNSGALGL